MAFVIKKVCFFCESFFFHFVPLLLSQTSLLLLCLLLNFPLHTLTFRTNKLVCFACCKYCCCCHCNGTFVFFDFRNNKLECFYYGFLLLIAFSATVITFFPLWHSGKNKLECLFIGFLIKTLPLLRLLSTFL